MRKKPPCSPDCPRRTVTCHSFCKDYKTWKAEDEERKRIRDEARAREDITFSPRLKKAMNEKIRRGNR